MNFNGSRFTQGQRRRRQLRPDRARLFVRRQLELRDVHPAERTARPALRAQYAPVDFGSDSTARSAVEAPTIIVNDSFTSGGAQRRGGTHARNYWFNSDLDYVRGIHSMRTGIEMQYARSRTDSDSNYLGTYVFENLDAFEAGRPRSYTRRIGDPTLSYTQRAGRPLHPGRLQGAQGTSRSPAASATKCRRTCPTS